jgi:hypothetical protein
VSPLSDTTSKRKRGWAGAQLNFGSDSCICPLDGKASMEEPPPHRAPQRTHLQAMARTPYSEFLGARANLSVQ